MPLLYKKLNRFASDRLNYTLKDGSVLTLTNGQQVPVKKEQLEELQKNPEVQTLMKEGVITLLKPEPKK